MASRFISSKQRLSEINSSAEIIEETPESSPAVIGYSRQATSRRIPSDPIDSGISDSGAKSTTPESRKHRSPQVIYASDSEEESVNQDTDELVEDSEDDHKDKSRFRGASINNGPSPAGDQSHDADSILVPRRKKGNQVISDEESDDEDESGLLSNKPAESSDESDDDEPLVRRRLNRNTISDDSSSDEDESGLVEKEKPSSKPKKQSMKDDSQEPSSENSLEENDYFTPTSESEDESQPIIRPKPSISSSRASSSAVSRASPSPLPSPESQPVSQPKKPASNHGQVVVLSSDEDEIQVVKEDIKTYSREDLNEIESQIRALKSTIMTNEYMLTVSGSRFGDGGMSVRQTIEEDKKKMELLRQKLGKARIQLAKSVSTGALPKPVQMSKTLSGTSLPAINNQPPEVLLERAKKKKNEIESALKYSSRLSDGGEKMRTKLGETEVEIEKLQKQVEDNLKITTSSTSPDVGNYVNKAWQTLKQNFTGQSADELARMMSTGPGQNLYGGRMTYDRQKEVKTVTQEAVTKLHRSLETMPAEGDMEDQPKHLKSSISLFPHQKQALAWLLWREHQNAPGGILADDMGLGKTLTMVSLILKDNELEQERKSDAEKENSWNVKGVGVLIKTNTTLIVCPASLMGQWENEVKTKVRSGCLRVLVYHGTGARKATAREMSRYDVIITTYGVILSEVKAELGDSFKESKKLENMKAAEEMTVKNGKLLSLAFRRIILDEAHQIRNPRSLQSQAVCKLRAARRWCVTGTPVQNKELDMYALVRFLRCNPFDEYLVWKRWVENKSAQSEERMNLLIKSLLLRRTKDQKSNITGKVLVELPDKNIVTHEIDLSQQEVEVYSEVEKFAKGAMQKFMDQQAESSERREIGFGGRGPARDEFAFKPYKDDEEEVKVHHLLTMLLRMRQICCHPGLIKGILDQETRQNEGIDEEVEELDLISKLEDMNISKKEEKSPDKILQMKNPVFSEDSPSSKISSVIGELKNMKKRCHENGVHEKAVVVSQWTAMLNIFKRHIKEEGFKFVEITGQVGISSRSEIVERFNKDGSGPQIMLLSLAAGGVGLNLVGANHLFLLDMHWNPQLENQACDRIYRVGQKRDVKIHKFLVKNSVEERIHQLQQNKLKLAEDLLLGAKNRAANKLTLEDMKSLFQVN